MRILIANDALVGSGGVESYLAALMPALSGRGHEVALLHANTRRESGATRLDAAALVASVADDTLEGAFDRVRAWRPDVCFSHNMRPLDVEERLLAEWPVVKMMHGYSGTCVSGLKAHAFPATVPCAREFGAACLALYLPRHCGQYRPLLMVEQFRRQSRQRSLLARYAAVVTASRHMADEYVRHGLARGRVVTAPLFPTEGTTASARELPPIPAVLFAGRMTSIKGGDVLVRAVAAASAQMAGPVSLIMAGDGPERSALEALARRLGVDATFTGWVAAGARTSLFRAASLVAVPSLWPEPFGLVGLDAGVHGVPAIAFDVGGIREWLRGDVNGLLVRERGSAAALGAALAQLLGDRDRLARYGDGAWRVARELSIEAHVTTVERLLGDAARATRAAV
jgi:glycosyltransferase involved in cell wall biosynthesis